MSGSRQLSSDRQAHDLLEALNQVVRELERSHSELEMPNTDSTRRQHLYYMVLSDMDRLANLLHLAESHNGGHLQDKTVTLIGETLTYVRKRATAIGVGIALNRIRALRRTADKSIKGHEHPLGRSFRLRDDLVDAVSLLHNFGLSLPQEHLDDLLDLAESINSLIMRDREISWLQPFGEDDEENCHLIDIQELVSRVAASERAAG